MGHKLSRFVRFWQELKRRKTGKVIVAYAATAFILLQLADILTPALSLPNWTTKLVIFLLASGFPIAVIFSWIFDITQAGIIKTVSIEESENKKNVTSPPKRIFRVSNIIIAALIIVVGILAYPKLFKRDALERLRLSGERITVAVMPFQNMTNDTLWNVWQDGIQDILITSLSNSEELKVRREESINNLVKAQRIVNYASMTPSVARIISKKLNANVLIYGSIKQAGSTLRLYTELLDPETKEIFKSFRIEDQYKEENIFHLVDSLSAMVKNFLIVSELEKQIPEIYRLSGMTNSPEAYRCFNQGRNEFMKDDYLTSINWYSKAVTIDSNFFQAMISISLAYYNQFEFETWFSSTYDKLYLFEEAKKWCLMAYKKSDEMNMQQKIYMNWVYASLFETEYEEIKYLKQMIESDDQWVNAYFNLGNSYNNSNQFEKAISEYEKALKIYKKWGLKPYWAANYTYLGQMYHKTEQYRKEEKVYRKAVKDFPDNFELIGWQGILALNKGDTTGANRYFKRFAAILRNMSISEAAITSTLAFAYNEAGIPDKAEDYYRRAMLLEPQNPDRVNSLAYFLIDRDRNINEGLKIIDKALKIISENFMYLHTKGWGLYKQGKYKEAVDILQKSWDIRREKAVYDYQAYLHLEAAKKAVAAMK